MKVFKMNEYDWVASESESEAIKFYLETTGVDKEEVGDIEECDIEKETMWLEKNFLEEEELKKIKKDILEVEMRSGSEIIKVTFKIVIGIFNGRGCQPKNEPYIIASTEY